MDNKGASVGQLVMVFIAVIVGITLLIATSTEIGGSTTTATNVNYTLVAADLTENNTVELDGRDFNSLVSSGNTTNPATVNTDETDYTSANFSLYTAQKSDDSGLTVTLRVNPPAVNSLGNGSDEVGWDAVNFSYQYNPDGYFTGSADRAIIKLVLVFLAIALLAVAAMPTLREGFLDMLKR